MDGIIYEHSNSLHSHIASAGLDPESGLVPTSEETSTTVAFYSMQNPYLSTASATSNQNPTQLPPTKVTVLDTSPSLSQSSNEHGTANRLISQQPDGQSETLGSPSTPAPKTGQQKCTRCKRWKMMDQFMSGGSNPQTFVGCLVCRETAKKYGQSEYGKATRRTYNQTAKAKETRKKYAQSEKGKESRKKYAQTKRAKETRKKYNQSEKAKAARRKRAMVKAGRIQEEQQGEEKAMENPTTFEIGPEFTDHIIFDPSQGGPNEKMNPMEKAFWQTVTKTMYDQARRHYSNDIDGHDKFEVDIQLKYRRTR